MNFHIILKLHGVIAFTLAVAFLASFAVSLMPSPIEDESDFGLRFLVCAAFSLIVGTVLSIAGRGGSTHMFRREALFITGTGWIHAALTGALPYVLIAQDTSLADAFFESASGLTTTGASVFGDIESLPRCLLFWRSLSQWIGGMGVVVFFVAVLGFLGAGGKILYSKEASGSTADFDEPRVQSAVLHLWLVYLGLSAACAVAFVLGGMSIYEAVCHMFTTVSTGGFSTRNDSFAGFDSPLIEWTGIVFMLLSAISFVLLFRLSRGSFYLAQRSSELKAFLAIILVASVATATALAMQGAEQSWLGAIRPATFQVVSIMTTSGFATADFDAWPAFPKVLLLMLMVIGGCSASTAGGIKVARIVIAWKAALRGIEMEFRPRVVRTLRMNGKPMEDTSIRDVLSFLVLVALLCLLAIPLTAAFEPDIGVQASISAVFACLFNIGPGLGEVGPVRNYAHLHAYTKVLLAMLMIVGRLELYAILVLFSPQLWRRLQ